MNSESLKSTNSYNLDLVFIDDNEFEFEIIKRVLQSSTVDHKCFSDPFEALAFLKINHARVIITDYRMPRLDGVSLLEQLSESYSLDSCHLYICSMTELPRDIDTRVAQLGALALLKDRVTEPGFLTTLCEYA